MKKLTKNSGITLIALVITIIVLLILAGVTIMSVTGENGILSRSISAREKTKEAQALEELKEKIMEVQIDKKGDATLQDIIDALKSDTENSYTVSTELATITGTLPDLADKTELYILYKDYWFKINSKLEVSFVKDAESSDNNIEEDKEEENIVKISDKASLEKFRDDINKGEKYENKIIKLTADIDLEGNESNIWIPIGNTDENAFTGTFDGDGHTIKNICISSGGTFKGLFGFNKGTIKNVGIESGKIITVSGEERTNATYIGFIAGHNSGTIEKCYNEASAEFDGGRANGGIAGYLDTNGEIKKCYNAGNLTGTTVADYATVCGILGLGGANSVVEDCYNTGNIKNIVIGGNSRAAGITDGSAKIESCYNTGNITLQQGENPQNYPVAAGICGQLHGGGMYNCYNTGETKIETTLKITLRNGGIVGYAGVEVKNCYCWCSEGVQGIGEDQRAEGKDTGVTVVETKEGIKNIVENLGSHYTTDSEGYPILTWQASNIDNN